MGVLVICDDCGLETSKDGNHATDADCMAALMADRDRCKAALQNMMGFFGGADTRLKLGKGFTDMHADAVKSGRDALAQSGSPPDADQ